MTSKPSCSWWVWRGSFGECDVDPLVSVTWILFLPIGSQADMGVFVKWRNSFSILVPLKIEIGLSVLFPVLELADTKRRAEITEFLQKKILSVMLSYQTM